MNVQTRTIDFFRVAWKRLTIVIVLVGLYITAAGLFGKLSVLVWLVVAMFATGFLLILILTRFRRFLISTAYQFIFGAKLVAFLLCIAGVYLTLYPLPERIPLISRLWFSLLALCFILSDIGYYLYSRDVNEAIRYAKEKLAEQGQELPIAPIVVGENKVEFKEIDKHLSTSEKLDQLADRVEVGISSVLRTEVENAKVAGDLQESRERADQHLGQPGEAADAAAVSSPEKLAERKTEE